MAAPAADTRRGRILAAALLLAATCIAYAPAMRGGLLWDDAAHVTRPSMRSLDGLRRTWFEVGATQQYYPLLHSAFWLQQRLWGDSLLGHHLVNVVMHALAAWLALLVLLRLGIPGARLTAAIFALHPVMVESVAWISELKNTLSAVFYLGALLAYLAFQERRGPRRYVLASFLFLCALATKTVTASLPAAILVIAWWRRGRIRRDADVVPLLPWFAMAALAGFSTAWVERHLIGAQGEAFDLGILQRVLLAGRVVWFYLGKLAWPADLIFIYPRWSLDPGAWRQWLFPAATAAVLVALVVLARRSRSEAGRAPLAALLFFVGTLFPALGFVNVFPFVYSFVADHFQYLAALGAITLAAAGLTLLARRIPPAARWTGHVAAAALLFVLGFLTWRQAHMYADVHVLYRTTIARNPSAWMAHNNLGTILAEEADLPGAVEAFEGALRARQDYPNGHFNLARVLARMGRHEEAIAHYLEVARLRPSHPELDLRLSESHDQRGLRLAADGRIEDALEQHRAAVRVSPASAPMRCNLGVALLAASRTREAVAEFRESLRLKADYPEALNNLAWVLATDPELCDPEQAIILAQRAVDASAEPGPELLDTLATARAAPCRRSPGPPGARP